MSETITINGRAFRVVSSTRAAPATKTKAKRAAIPLCGPAIAKGALTLTTVPPSLNNIFVNRGKGRGKSLSYKNWCAAADHELRGQPAWHVPGKVEISIWIPIDTRGDADNRIKAALDAMVRAGRIEDDKNVVKVSAEFGPVKKTTVLIQGRR